jgi:transcriptional regulator with XRE-family HTH domain
MAREFKTLLKLFRLRAGYGLREFAELLGESPGNYHGVESGKRAPWRSAEKLRRVADALALEEGSRDWDAFFVAARENGALPPDMEHLLEKPGVLMVLRTIDELRLTEAELRALVEHLHKTRRSATSADKRPH